MEIESKARLAFLGFGVILPACLIVAHIVTKEDLLFISIMASLIVSGALLIFTEGISE
ncbi:MAG: hypothetical protein HZB92_07390 [Euryarchaeota archaeon]|nr:hypothetical protein [Euryarchaeota archaeon]